MGRVYLVTGSTGHLGRNIIMTLLSLDKKVNVLIMPNDKHQDFNYPNNQSITKIYGNILSKEDLTKFFDSASNYSEVVLIHAAGMVSIKGGYDEKVYKVNVEGTKNIVDMACKYKVNKLIYVSSVHAFNVDSKDSHITEESTIDETKAIGLYAKTKAEATKYVINKCLANKLDYNIVFPSGLIGPNDELLGHITTVIKDYLTGNLTSIVKGGYDMVDVRDVAKTIVQLTDTDYEGETFILSNRFITIKELVDICAAKVNRKTVRHVLPIWFVKSIAPLAELYAKIKKEKPIFTSYSMTALSEKVSYSHLKASKLLSYKPTDLRTTLEDTVDYLLASGVKLKKR